MREVCPADAALPWALLSAATTTTTISSRGRNKKAVVLVKQKASQSPLQQNKNLSWEDKSKPAQRSLTKAARPLLHRRRHHRKDPRWLSKKKKENGPPKKEKHAPTKSAKASLEATPTASAPKTDTAGSTSSGSPGCAENAPAAQLDDVLASLVAQVHQLSNMVPCIQEEQNLILQDGRFRIQLEAASISELSHRLADQFATAYPGLEFAAPPPTSSLPERPDESIYAL